MKIGVHQYKVACKAIDIGDDVSFRIQPRFVAENGCHAFDDDTVSDLGKKDWIAKLVCANGILEMIDRGLGGSLAAFQPFCASDLVDFVVGDDFVVFFARRHIDHSTTS